MVALNMYNNKWDNDGSIKNKWPWSKNNLKSKIEEINGKKWKFRRMFWQGKWVKVNDCFEKGKCVNVLKEWWLTVKESEWMLKNDEMEEWRNMNVKIVMW